MIKSSISGAEKIENKLELCKIPIEILIFYFQFFNFSRFSWLLGESSFGDPARQLWGSSGQEALRWILKQYLTIPLKIQAIPLESLAIPFEIH